MGNDDICFLKKLDIIKYFYMTIHLLSLNYSNIYYSSYNRGHHLTIQLYIISNTFWRNNLVTKMNLFDYFETLTTFIGTINFWCIHLVQKKRQKEHGYKSINIPMKYEKIIYFLRLTLFQRTLCKLSFLDDKFQM